jgi:CRISPR-associated exonuclease Cas4
MIELALLALVLAFVSALAWWVGRARPRVGEEAWLPPTVRDAQLDFREHTFRATWPLALVARVDRAYRKADGVIVLVELKTRAADRTYLSDVIELSAQRVAIESEAGLRVDDVAYVVIERGGRITRTARAVKLLGTDEIVALARRRDLILARPVAARCTTSRGLCARCSYRRECRAL